jgi:catechol 2,3-dioxygenase-like lactoylglutathione lyase family enzyme
MHFGFDHVHLVGSDLDASERFYRDMFGAVTIARRDARGAVNLMMKLDGINLFIRNSRPTEQVTGDGTDIRCTYDHIGVALRTCGGGRRLRSGRQVLQSPQRSARHPGSS